MARHFNGTTSDYILAASALTSTAPGAYTWAGWLKGDSAPSLTTLQVAWSAAEASAYASGAMLFGYGNSGGTDQTAFHTNQTARIASALSGSTWYHIAATWNGSTVTVYLNGSSSASTAAASILWTNPMKAALATEVAGVPRSSFPGSIADFAFWNIVLTAQNLTDLASGKRADHVNALNMLIYWPLLGDSPELDKSGNGINGTVVGTTVVSDPPLLEPWAASYVMFGVQSSMTVPIITVQNW